MTRLNDAYPNGMLGDGVFLDLKGVGVPWADDVNAYDLDIAYYSHSGNKRASPPILYRIEQGIWNNVNRLSIAETIYRYNKAKWDGLYRTLNLEYNPIENYRMTETESASGTHSAETSARTTGSGQSGYTDTYDLTDTEARTDTTKRTGTDTHTQTGTDTTLHSGSTIDQKDGEESTSSTVNVTETRTENASGNDTVGLYGFDSAEAVNSDVTATTATTAANATTGTTNTGRTETAVTDTETVNLTDQRTANLTDTETHNTTDELKIDGTTEKSGTVGRAASESSTGSTSGTESGTDSSNRTLTRFGNIGVTTSQQMIESERTLNMWRYFDIIFTDVDSFLTIPIY